MAHFSSSLCVAWFFGARHPIAMVLGLLGFVFVLWPRLWHFWPLYVGSWFCWQCLGAPFGWRWCSISRMVLLVLFSLATNWAHFASLLLTFEALAALFFVMFV